ncbi:MFS transporter [Clostridium sp. HMP27]|uniref:MFS transporter n=1 Tax=Clostridium sp. HMP27 TaxID=1487921 RepID=UPI00052C69E1|nr:MFS transporter [Clostridium sp. HMP27]KGK86989.1 permease [Clostridium sp. HMP27]
MNKKNSTLVLVLFLLGIFMGAIDSGIVSPARELIQKSFGVERSIGTWMITLYTLIYAVAMPIVSKLADRYGYKIIYVSGIAVFGIGSLLCGLANFYGNFTFFLVARGIQAVGAGGIIPIANAYIGQSFPEEKRGTALGLVGAIYGVANILGPTIGSAILNIFGNDQWGFIFFINVPISLFIILLSRVMENTKADNKKAMDIAGSIVIAGVIGTLMYALTNINFFNLGESIKSTSVYPYLIAFAILLPILIFIERRTEDPVLNLKYFKSKQILTILILAFIVGIGMMGMVFVPQFAENTLKIKAGNGGYLVTLLAVFSGISAPLSGKLIDKKGARFVLILGFSFNIIGTLFLGIVAAKSLSFISILIGLALMGFGVGFTLGAPLNYLILQAVPEREGATALATMSLIRSIGVTISPSIMIGFIVNAASNLQGNLMKVLGNMMPKSGSMAASANAGGQNAKLFQGLQNADVTTIVDSLKNVLKQVVPPQAQSQIVNGIEAMRAQIESVFQLTLNEGYAQMFIAAAVIAFLGLITTFLLSKNAIKNVTQKETI